MKHETEIRELLIENTINLIAIGGFEKATTKELTHCGGELPEFRMNEVYIYRLFGSKEDLFKTAFMRLDEELFSAFKYGTEIMGGIDSSKQKLKAFFDMAWRFIMKNEYRCRCYVRFYYSIYFSGSTMKAHKQLFNGIVAKMSPLFKREADVEAILHSVFTALLDFAIRVYNGDLEDSEINRPHMFNVLYCMMLTYFNDQGKVP